MHGCHCRMGSMEAYSYRHHAMPTTLRWEFCYTQPRGDAGTAQWIARQAGGGRGGGHLPPPMQLSASKEAPMQMHR